MTEKRKQELRQLLDEAIPNVVIEVSERYKSISVEEYTEHAKAFRESYRPDLSFILDYQPNIQDDTVKSKLFNFMKEELVDYIREDESIYPPYTHWIQPSQRAIRGAKRLIPLPPDRLLEKLLEIVIASGTEQAISVLDRCPRDIGTFQEIIFLQGLYVCYSGTTKEAREIHIAEGVRFIQLPSCSEDLLSYLFHERLIPHLFHESFIPMVDNTGRSIFSHAPLLIIDYTVSPLFSKPSLKEQLDVSDQIEIKIRSAEFPNFDVGKFCQALSLIANYAVQPLLKWQYISEDELFNVEGWFPKEMGNLVMPDYLSGIGVINEIDIDKAKGLYELLTNLSSNIGRKLQIPIDRWIKSKAERKPVDKIIDLGITLESLYLSGIESKNEIRFRFSRHAAWYLGENSKEHREGLMKKFKEIYDWRSAVVHTGKLPNKTRRTPFTQEEIRDFIKKTQDLYRDSIIKILEDGRIPDWNNLILG